MALTFDVKNNIGVLTFDQDDSKVNLLSAEIIQQLDGFLEKIAHNSNLAALIVKSHKKNVFIAGADLKEIEKIVEPRDGQQKAEAGQNVLNKLQDLKIPTIAVIDGAALGGGCELALACHYRVSTFNPKVRIGLPEVNLGIIPGFAGTYRLPKIVGLSESLKIILSGQPVDSLKALKIGLVDKLFPQEGLDQSVSTFVDHVIGAQVKKPRFYRPKKKGIAQFLEDALWGRVMVFHQSKKSVLSATKGFYPSP